MALATLLVSALLAPPGSSLLVNGSFASGLSGWEAVQPGRTPRIVGTEEPRAPHGVRFEMGPAVGGPPSATSLSQRIPSPLKAGEPLTLTFLARSPTRSRISAFVRQGEEPSADVIRQDYGLSSEWRAYELEGAPRRNLGANQAVAGFHLNYGSGIVEIGGVRLAHSIRLRATKGAPDSLIVNGDFSQPLGVGWFLSGPITAPPEVVAGERRALRLSSHPPAGAPPWIVELRQPNTTAIVPGDVVTFRAWMRSPTSSRVGVYYEMAGEPHTKFMKGVFLLRPEWKQYRLAAQIPQSFPIGHARLSLYLGYAPGVVEIADVRMENHGAARLANFEQTQEPYGGLPAPEAWRVDAEARIEKFRKGDLTIRVVDADGRPVRSAWVQVEQRSHAFRFGTVGPAALLVATDENARRYQATLKRLFNAYAFENDLDWGTLGTRSTEEILRIRNALAWLEQGKFDVKGRNLLRGSFRRLPVAFETLSLNAARQAVLQRVQQTVAAYQGRLYAWEVVSEASSERELWNKIGWAQLPEVFRAARRADPKVKLVYSERGITQEASAGAGARQEVQRLVQGLQEAGAPADLIGMLGHVRAPLTPIPRVLEIVEEMALMARGLEVTDFDVEVSDDKLQAEYLRDFLTAMFSHPKVESFFMGGFWEGAYRSTNEGGAMIRRDWTSRPSAAAYESLVRGKWWTQAALTTNAQGYAKTRAFYGTHSLKVLAQDRRYAREVKLERGVPGVVTVQLQTLRQVPP